MPEGSERKKVLEEAIRFETDGREFFLKAAEKAKNYFTKTIFQIIAEEELDHIKKIKQIYESSLTSGEGQLPAQAPKKNTLQNVFHQGKEDTDQKLAMNADELEAVRMAIQLEIKGQEFYDRLTKEAVSEFEKAFYRHLAQEEEVHFSVLRQMEEAVMNPKSFG